MLDILHTPPPPPQVFIQLIKLYAGFRIYSMYLKAEWKTVLASEAS